MVSPQDIYRKGLHYISHVVNDGKSIYSMEWDTLIILDACRYDLFCEVSSEYDFIDGVEKMESVDTMTPIWMEKTFTEDVRSETAETYYICSNPASDKKLTDSQFAKLDEIWRYKWNKNVNNVRAEDVTRRAITIGRKQNPQRLLIHYNQPHWPFIPSMETSNNKGIELSNFGEHQDHRVWERLRRGEVSKEEVWEGYKENLRYVLDSVSVLLKNLDSERVLITSDHGNSLGEWGIYGHPAHMPVPSIRQVPITETSAVDEFTMEDHLEYSENNVESDVEQKLRDLGYR